ncbi:MAG: FAD-dependent oxidoreductase [Roseburia sp.]|nr:FAD-dependent oxidoreductase [Roseburia sp.]
MNSLWSETVDIPGKEPLRHDMRTDVLIIGGGMAGVLCAWQLKQAGVDYVLVEEQTLCSGITKDTTAKITSQHGLIYDKLTNRFGLEGARKYLEANEAALEEYRGLCRDIDCEFREADSVIYTMDRRDKIEKEVKALERIGCPAGFTTKTELPFEVQGAVRVPGQAQFHPLKFVRALTPGLKVYEHTKVLELAKGCAITDGGKITAKHMIVATHFPLLNKHGSYFLKQYQHRSYVIAYENARKVEGMYVDESEKGLSFRSYGDLLLIGGGSHRTGKQGGSWQELSDFAARYYPDSRERYRWATQDCMTLDDMPYIGQYSRHTPGLYVATGFHKWGMTSSMVAAGILRDAVIGRDNPYAELFSPSRSMLRPQLAVNAFESAIHLLRPARKRCPHLGCALTWNRAEHSWDCACHGSRFAKDGKLLNNPATDDLKG